MKTCCFLGHRNTEKTQELCGRVRETVKYLIEEKGVRKFLFGSKSKFKIICYEIVMEFKNTQSDIKTVYVRSAFRYISQDYLDYLLESFDETYMPESVFNAGRLSYIKRDQAMIDSADYCVFYYDKKNAPKKKSRYERFSDRKPNSGTGVSYEYAKRKKKEIFNLFEERKNA